MTIQQELLEYIQNLTPEQVNKISERIHLMEKYLALTEQLAAAECKGELDADMPTMKREYIEAITTALHKTNDLSLLDLIYQLLVKSSQRK